MIAKSERLEHEHPSDARWQGRGISRNTLRAGTFLAALLGLGSAAFDNQAHAATALGPATEHLVSALQ